ncbi:MAG: hypothetical protein ABI351_14015 [Herbaspirillum sp.]
MHYIIAFYLERDGAASCRESISMQLGVALRAVLNAASHASLPQYRDRFLEDAAAYAAYLGDDATPVMHAVIDEIRRKRVDVNPRQAPLSDQLLAVANQNVTQIIAALRTPSVPTANDMPADSELVERRLEQALALLKEHGIAVPELV